jgi:hypothetical protein
MYIEQKQIRRKPATNMEMLPYLYNKSYQKHTKIVCDLMDCLVILNLTENSMVEKG